MKLGSRLKFVSWRHLRLCMLEFCRIQTPPALDCDVTYIEPTPPVMCPSLTGRPSFTPHHFSNFPIEFCSDVYETSISFEKLFAVLVISVVLNFPDIQQLKVYVSCQAIRYKQLRINKSCKNNWATNCKIYYRVK